MCKNTKRTVIKLILIVCGIFSLSGGLLCSGVMRYLNRVPQIQAKENLHFSAGSDLLPDDLAEISVADSKITVVKRITEAFWADDTSDDIRIEQNGRAVSVGDRTGLLFVTVTATGVESRDVTVPVRITEP